jgi:hypothetical protein
MIDRRRFLARALGAGPTLLAGAVARRAEADPPPETRRIRLVNRPTLCEAPQYVATHIYAFMAIILGQIGLNVGSTKESRRRRRSSRRGRNGGSSTSSGRS